MMDKILKYLNYIFTLIGVSVAIMFLTLDIDTTKYIAISYIVIYLTDFLLQMKLGKLDNREITKKAILFIIIFIVFGKVVLKN